MSPSTKRNDLPPSSNPTQSNARLFARCALHVPSRPPAMSHHSVERVRRHITGQLEAQQLPRSLDVQVGPQQRLQLASEGHLLQGPRDRAPQQKHVRKRNQPLMRQMSEESHAESHAFQPRKSAQILRLVVCGGSTRSLGASAGGARASAPLKHDKRTFQTAWPILSQPVSLVMVMARSACFGLFTHIWRHTHVFTPSL